HEQLAIEAHRLDPHGNGNIKMAHMENGGTWLYGRSSVEIQCFVDMLADLPIAIEVMTIAGRVGIVHADCPFHTWDRLAAMLELREKTALRKASDYCQWSRNRIINEDYSGVGGIRALIVGHSAVRRV